MDTVKKPAAKYCPETEAEVLRKLAEAGRRMTARDHLDQMRGVMYGTPNPSPETRREVGAYMKKYYSV